MEMKSTSPPPDIQYLHIQKGLCPSLSRSVKKQQTLHDDVVVDLVLPVHVLNAAGVLALVALGQPVHTQRPIRKYLGRDEAIKKCHSML